MMTMVRYYFLIVITVLLSFLLSPCLKGARRGRPKMHLKSLLERV